MNTNAEFKNQLCGQFKNLFAVRAGVLLLCLAAASSPAQTYTVLINFPQTNSAPHGNVVVSGTTLYGMVWRSIFAVSTSGSNYSAIWFAGTNGSCTSLILSNTTLYGTARIGSTGTVFSINTDGSGYTLLKQFTGGLTEGFYPNNGLVLSGGTLYGTTPNGGSSGYGTVFKVNTDGSGYATLKLFAGSDGSQPLAGLVLSGTTLYGTTGVGGTNGYGTVFKLNTDGSGYTVLKAFGRLEAEPCASLALSDTTLFGTCCSDDQKTGIVFKLNTDGSGYTLLKQFTGSDGANPQAALVLSGEMLYGTTLSGGSYGYGTIFQVDTNGGSFAVLKHCSWYEGGNPGQLVLNGTTLYGVGDGGSLGSGVLFSLSLVPPSVITPPQSQTAELGSTVDFVVNIGVDPVLGYQWFFNSTNIISNANNSDLQLTNVQFSDSGVYTVILTNLCGAVTSSPAMLNVIPMVERRPVPGVNLMGDVGASLNVEYTDALGFPANWLPLDTVNLTNPPQFCFDLTTPLPPQRFYRAWQSGTPSVAPSLSLPGMVPAITLTGNVGDSLQLDYINQFGPTNAWVTLDTITLTNTSQLYFDVSALGQPPRLYQIVPVP